MSKELRMSDFLEDVFLMVASEGKECLAEIFEHSVVGLELNKHKYITFKICEEIVSVKDKKIRSEVLVLVENNILGAFSIICTVDSFEKEQIKYSDFSDADCRRYDNLGDFLRFVMVSKFFDKYIQYNHLLALTYECVNDDGEVIFSTKMEGEDKPIDSINIKTQV